MSHRPELHRLLASSLLATGWERAELESTIQRFATKRGTGWKRSAAVLAAAVLSEYPQCPADRPRELAGFIRDFMATPSEGSRNGAGRAVVLTRSHVSSAAPSIMVRNRWGVPILNTVSELAEFCEVSLPELHWFADTRAYHIRQPAGPLHHYDYIWAPKARGGHRLLEQPKPRMKALQRLILRRILECVPSHPAAHGFVTSRSPLTAVQPHVGQRVVLRIDLRNFFTSVQAQRVYGIWRTCGYPESVAYTLTGLVTTRTPLFVRSEYRRNRPPHPSTAPHHEPAGSLDRLRDAHLPQGAPTSPALANLAAYAFDRRIAGLSARFGASYTRYADDLLMSGGPLLLASVDVFRRLADEVVRSEGFVVNAAKTAVMTDAGRQRILGVVVNEKPNVARTGYDELRATLHNCATKGWSTQQRGTNADFRAHLLGRIGWVRALNPERGTKLQALFDRIDWSASVA